MNRSVGSVKLAAPVWVCSVIVTVAVRSRPVVIAETVKDDSSTPDESMSMVVGDTEALEIVGRPGGQPPAGQKVTVVGEIFEFAFPSLLLRTSVKVTYCDPAPNIGGVEPGNDNDQLTPSPEVNGNCEGQGRDAEVGLGRQGVEGHVDLIGG